MTTPGAPVPLDVLFREQALARATGPAGADADRGSRTIAEWAASTSWDAVLSPDWTHAGHDRCGCSIWTAPGPHESPKSATAHDGGCQMARDDGRLHVWTDDPPPYLVGAGRGQRGRSHTKLDIVSLRDFGGDYGQACSSLGIEYSDDVQQRLDDERDEMDELLAVLDSPDTDDSPAAPHAPARSPESGAQSPPEPPDAADGHTAPQDDHEPRPDESVADYVHRVAADTVEALHHADELVLVRHHAEMLGTSMLTLLPVVLMHVAACVPWHRTLPGAPVLVHTPASLNIASVLLGPSGSGKSSLVFGAREILDVRSTADDETDVLATISSRYRSVSVGSGQGLAHALARKPDKTDEDDVIDDTGGSPLVWRDEHRSTLVTHDEWMRTISAARQNASTLSAEMRTSITGGPLGGVTATREHSLQPAALSYRQVQIVGAQPGLTPGLADDEAVVAGTTQRFLWAPAGRPSSGMDVDHVRQRAREQRRTRRASGSESPLPKIIIPVVDGVGPVHVDDSVADEIVEDYELRQEGLLDPTGGHDTRMRAVVAVSLSVLAAGARGQTRTDAVLSRDVWDLAGLVMAVHESVRRYAVWAQGSIERAEEQRRADARSARRLRDDRRSALAVAEDYERRLDTRARAVRERLIAEATSGGPQGAPIRYREWTKGQRSVLDDEIEHLVADGTHVVRKVRTKRVSTRVLYAVEHDPGIDDVNP